MKNSLLWIIVVGLIAAGGYLFYQSTATKVQPGQVEFAGEVPPMNGKVRFQFTTLPDNRLAEIDGEFLRVDDLQDVVLDSLIEKRADLEERGETDPSNFYFGSINSQIFRRQLQLIDKLLKERFLNQAVLKSGIGHVEYLEKKVYKDKNTTATEEEVAIYMTEKGYDDTEKFRTLAQQNIIRDKKKKLLDYYLEKEVMNLPIKVNLKKPSFASDVRLDWTPSLGPEDAKSKVIIIADFWTATSQRLLAAIPDLASRFPNVFFGFRPFYLGNDRYQRMLAEAAFCGWMGDRKKFWDFLPELSLSTRDTIDKDVKSATSIFEDKASKVHQCFLNRKYKEVVDYHLKYAAYLKLQSVPVVLVDGEVFIGAPKVSEIAEAIARQRGLPSAAIEPEITP